MPFPCPACGATVERSPEGWLLRCPSCRAVLRSTPLEGAGETRTYEMEAVGRPETRRRVEVPWDGAEQQRLHRWLLWSSIVTLALVGVLYLLARLR